MHMFIYIYIFFSSRGKNPEEYEAGSDLSFLLKAKWQVHNTSLSLKSEMCFYVMILGFTVDLCACFYVLLL
jgi:hypothetical protein